MPTLVAGMAFALVVLAVWALLLGGALVALALLVFIAAGRLLSRSPSGPPLPHPRPPTVWVVLPARDEGEHIGELLDRVGGVLQEAGQAYRLLVVDDGSVDETAVLAQARAGRQPVIVLVNATPEGHGRALGRGLREAAACSDLGDAVVTMEADLSQDPAAIPALLAAYQEGADVVVASRFRPGASVLGVSLLRRLLSGGARVGLGLLLPVPGVRDHSCGFRLYDANLLRRTFAELQEDFVTQRGVACNLEILGKLRRRAVVREIPVTLDYGGQSRRHGLGVVAKTRAYLSVVVAVWRVEFRGWRRP